jgi:hypothetical protein
MVPDPTDVLFPLVTSLVFVGLAGGALRRAKDLSGMALDWAVAFVFAAVAFAGITAGALSEWSEGGEAVLAGGAAACSLALLAVFSRMLQRFARGWIGSQTFRWLTLCAAVGAAAFGWGAYDGWRTALGDGHIDAWVLAPVAAPLMVMLAFALLVTRHLLGRGQGAGPFLLFIGVLLMAAGMLTLALGQILIGCAMAMTGGGLLYAAASSAAPLAPGEAPPLLRPRVEVPERSRATKGVKVRIPKGDAVRVSAYGNGEKPPEIRR